MGNFFTTMQIYDDEKMSQEQFIDKFCREICDEGYVACGSDESELSYILKFADNSQWVTITSEDYKDDMELPRKDVVRISKMLGMACVQTTVIDSDCAIMELYNEKGEQADMFVMGRADDYFGNNIPQPKESIWKPFLTEGTSWDEFNNIKNGDYVFVEDGLSELAPAIGMNSRNIVFEADEAVEDEQTVFLNFRKADAKKEKKLTLNAAFKQVFGEALEPLGFKLLKKTKTPIFVRFINDEIMHVITYRKLGAMKTGYNRYEVSCGAISLYRRNIDLDDSPENWLINMGRYYYAYNISVSRELKLELIQFRYDIWGRTLDKGLDESTLEEEFTRSLFESQCNANDSTEMLNGIRLTCKVFKEIALPVLNSIIDLDSYIEFCYEMTPKRLKLAEINEFISDERYSGSDGLILILANYRNDGKERTARMLEKGIMALGRRKTPEKIEMLKASYENERAFQVAVRDRILDTPELKSKAMNEAKKIQSSNIDRFKALK